LPELTRIASFWQQTGSTSGGPRDKNPCTTSVCRTLALRPMQAAPWQCLLRQHDLRRGPRSCGKEENDERSLEQKADGHRLGDPGTAHPRSRPQRSRVRRLFHRQFRPRRRPTIASHTYFAREGPTSSPRTAANLRTAGIDARNPTSCSGSRVLLSGRAQTFSIETLPTGAEQSTQVTP
jgi:hypothetical protein